MKKLWLFLVSFLLVSQAFAGDCPVQEQYTLKLKFVDVETGELFKAGCLTGGDGWEEQVWPYVYLYDAVTSEAVAWGKPCNGLLTMSVPAGTYVLEMIAYKNQQWRYLAYSGAPSILKASTITVKGNTTRTIKLTDKMPTITTVSPEILVRGQEAVISGTNFGTTKGYISFNGYLTNSSTYILSWTDTEIHVKVPNYATTGNLQICTAYSGCGPSYCMTVTN